MKKFLLLLAVFCLVASSAFADGKTGVLVMHGKHGTPDKAADAVVDWLKEAVR